MIPLTSESAAIALTADLRDAAIETWRTGDPRGIDLSAIEHIDRRSLDVVREDGVDRRLAITLPHQTDVVLLAQMELSPAFAARDLWRDLETRSREDWRTRRWRGSVNCSIAMARCRTPRSRCRQTRGARRHSSSCAKRCRPVSIVACRSRDRRTRESPRPRRT